MSEKLVTKTPYLNQKKAHVIFSPPNFSTSSLDRTGTLTVDHAGTTPKGSQRSEDPCPGRVSLILQSFTG